MDKIRIQKWIEQTKIDEEAETLHELGLHPFLAGRGAAADLPPTGRSKRKRSHTDSSLLQAQPACKRSLRGDIDSDAEEKLLKTSSDALLDPGSSASESSTPSNKYQRKPRHKTRPDLYEVKEKSRAKPVNDGGNGKRRKSKRKTRKRKEDRQGTGLVQAFRAKNVASERLTLKQCAPVGMFGRGRASSPHKGRGLPDLTFSEMRFLQKPRQAGHELNPTEMSRASGKKDRNRDRKRSNNYEISGYFATKKVSRAENAGNVQKLPTKHPLGDSKRDHKIRTYRSSLGRESVHTVIPTVEARESSVVEQYDSRKSSTGETPFTWSESNPQSKGHKVFPRDFSAIHVGQLDENSPLQIHINQGRVVHNRGPSSAPTDSGSFRPSDETLPSRHGSQSHVMERGATIRLNHLQRNREPIRSGQDLKEMLVAEHHRYSAVETPIYSKNDGGRLSHQPPDVRTQSSETNSNKIRKETPERRCSPDVKRGQPDKTRDRVDPATSSSLGQLLKRCDAAFDVPGNDVDAQDTYAANYQPQNLADDDIQHSHIRYPRIYDQFDEPYDENLGAVNDYVGDDTFIFAIPHDNNTHIDYGEFDLGFNEGQYEFLGAEGGGEIDAIDIGAEGLEEGVSVLLPCQDDECEVTESAIFEERTIPEEPLMTREGLFLDERFQNFWRPNRLY